MQKTATRNIHIEALSRSLGAPSIDGLIYSLRHPETWPKGFVWNFNECNQCAMGLASALWSAEASDSLVGGDDWVSHAARMLALPYAEAENIFLGDFATRPKTFLGVTYGHAEIPFEDVTPEMVADALEKYLAKAA